MKEHGTKGIHENFVLYKNPRKPIISKSESKRQKLSSRRWNVNGGGDDIA